ncbi:MAG TPA: bifunctional pyr operon transcriptional regulator/uracil phosphoribosyltransferase PyrR [Terriglobales bacterium]|nr:bifunctional pyr operon transcriptional regulator/uracil phosphoribosyltransferase PyrR [Terriglobales bacterium]
MSSQSKPGASPVEDKGLLMSASEIQRTLVRLAHEVVEKNNGVDGLALVGIRRRGFPLAQRIAKVINQIEHTHIPVGSLDITLYRDDLSTVGPKPLVQKSDLEFSVAGKNVVLVDDVLYTGRTTRAALDALFDHGRPARVQLLVLIDRGHRELPIEAAFVGRKVQTTDTQVVEVKLKEVDNLERIQVMERSERGPTR